MAQTKGELAKNTLANTDWTARATTQGWPGKNVRKDFENFFENCHKSRVLDVKGGLGHHCHGPTTNAKLVHHSLELKSHTLKTPRVAHDFMQQDKRHHTAAHGITAPSTKCLTTKWHWKDDQISYNVGV